MIIRSIRKLAPLIGISHTMLNRHLKNGKIHRDPDGTFDLNKVRRELKESCDVAQSRRTSKRSQGIETPPDVEIAAGDSYTAFNRARAMKEIVVAKQKQLDLRKRQGELVEVAEVEKEWGNIISSVRSRLLLLPDKLAPRVAIISNVLECRAIIDHEIKEILRSLTECKTDAA